MIWRTLGDLDYATDIPAFLAALQQRGGEIRSISLNTAEFEVANEAVRRGLVSIEQMGSAEQMFRLLPALSPVPIAHGRGGPADGEAHTAG